VYCGGGIKRIGVDRAHKIMPKKKAMGGKLLPGGCNSAREFVKSNQSLIGVIEEFVGIRGQKSLSFLTLGVMAKL
jgi:hypothetical protein